MVGGIDKSGKGTAAGAMIDWVRSSGKNVFDLVAYQKEKNHLPDFEEMMQVQPETEFVFSGEPTYSWIGKAIRQEVIADNNRDYDARHTAELFSFDRMLLYRRLLLPALAAGIGWIQERGVETSDAYQPVQAKHQGKDLPRSYVRGLDGNKFAMQHRPDLLVLVHCDALVAFNRKRPEKDDNCSFEKRVDFLRDAEAAYRDIQTSQYFKDHGSHVIEIDTSTWQPDQTRTESVALLRQYLSSVPPKFSAVNTPI